MTDKTLITIFIGMQVVLSALLLIVLLYCRQIVGLIQPKTAKLVKKAPKKATKVAPELPKQAPKPVESVKTPTNPVPNTPKPAVAPSSPIVVPTATIPTLPKVTCGMCGGAIVSGQPHTCRAKRKLSI